MNESHYKPIRKFNPGTFQSDEEVTRQFVVRKKELDIVLEVVRGNIDSPSCQHILVVAPRGMGKTMLLARVAAELRTDEELSKRLFPVRFMEESQEIFTMADFWLETLFHLARESAAHDPGFAKELQATHAALVDHWHDTTLEQHARSAVLEATDRMGKKLVLMVENLQSLCESVDNDFGWKLREVLQSEPGIILLATATSRFKGLDDVNQPFFELFRSLYLEPLDTEACGRLWQVISGDEKKGREIKPLKILTGGSPRLLVIIAEFAHHQSLRELLGNLVQMIDDHSEYFRGHLENIAPKERRVYLAVIDLWQMSSSNEIAARARMDIRTVSSLLGRLVARGAVIVEGSGKKRLYTATERLYSIYYKLRRERDEASLVQNLIQFMTVFYMEDELAELSGRFISEAAQSPIIVFSNMTQPDINRIFKKADAAIDEYDNWSNKVVAMEPSGQYGTANEVRDESADNSKKSYSNEIQLQIVRALVNKGVEQGKSGELEAAIATFNEVIEQFGRSNELEIQVQVVRALGNKVFVLGCSGQHESAIAACDEMIELYGESSVVKIQEMIVRALVNKGVSLVLLGEHEKAKVARNGVDSSDSPEIQEQDVKALANNGDMQLFLDYTEESLLTCDEIERRISTLSEHENIEIKWHTSWLRTKALLAQGNIQAGLDTFRSMYDGFVPGDPKMINKIMECLFDLITSGVPELDLINLLSSDPDKSNAFGPLLVALRQYAGEEVRAPAEVLEVAADIREKIEEITKKDNSEVS
ncbi:MAG: ATP-binding protein [Gammaproteobacteria bacterium]|nr:ATP-binding protein [Gammaproteobacteria bacterium]